MLFAWKVPMQKRRAFSRNPFGFSQAVRQRSTSNSEKNLRESAKSADETVLRGNPMFTEPRSIDYNLA
jgi:hypothetical protein